MFWLAFLTLIAATSGASRVLRPVEPEEVGMASSSLLKMRQAVEETIREGKVPGAVVVVARRGGIVYRKAFGYRALQPRKEPMTVDTVFDLASLTKVVATAPSIMILAEEGRLHLRDPVARFLPAFARHGKRQVTILQLLTHFSGLRAGLDQDEVWAGFQEAVRRAAEERLIAIPGSRFIYSDINYVVLSAVLTEVAGMSLQRFSSTRIFAPLGMRNTTFHPPASWRGRIAPTEVREGRMLRGRVHDPLSERAGGTAGNAGLFSTAGDLAVYAQMILNRGVYGEVRILAPQSVEKLTTNQSPAGQESWRGAGFDLRTSFSFGPGDRLSPKSFGHTGFTGTSLWIDPDSEVFLVLLTSRLHPESDGDVAALRRELVFLAAAAVEDRTGTSLRKD